MIIVDNISQDEDRDEWLKMRAGVLTGTGFAKTLTKGRGNKPSLVRTGYLAEIATERITGRCVDGFGGTWEMKKGRELEPQARALYELQSGNKVKQAAIVFLAEDRRIGISPDGLIEAPTGSRTNPVGHYPIEGNWENKSPKLATHVRYLLKHWEDPNWYPSEYEYQVQGQMWVTGAAWCDFTSYCPDSNIELMRVRVKRDEVCIARIKKAAAIFIIESDRLETTLRGMAE